MNTRQLIRAAVSFVAIAASAASFAGEASYDYPTSPMSTLTRAEVRAMTVQARADGLIPLGDKPVVVATVGTPKTRVQVVAETLEAIRVGAIDHRERTTFPSSEQLQQIEQAGLRALGMTVASL